MSRKRRKTGNNNENSKNNRAATARDPRRAEKTEQEVESRTNDVEWYSKNPALLQQVANLAIGWPLGTGYNLSNLHYTHGMSTDSDPDYQPAICVFDAIPGPGISQDATSAVTAAARGVYSFIRHANSGHSNYDSQDFMLYLLAMDQLFTMWWAGIRMLSLINTTNVENVYMPQHICEAIGFDYSDFVGQGPRLAAFLNNVSAKIGVRLIPNKFPLFDRHRMLFTGVYADTEMPKAQLYAFRPAGYYVFGLDDNQAGMLKFKRIDYTDPIKLVEYENIINEMLSPIMAQEDFGIMGGDVLKAYGTDGVYKLPVLTDNVYTLDILYDETVLSQIENATLMGKAKTDSEYDITQDTSIGAGFVIFNPHWSASYLSSYVNDLSHDPRCSSRLLNFHVDQPDPGAVVEATRFTCIATSSSVEGAIELAASGADILETAHFYYYTGSGSAKVLNQTTSIGMLNISAAPSETAASVFNQLSLLQKTLILMGKFNRHPAVYVNVAQLDKAQSGASFININSEVLFDIDQYTVIHSDTLGNIHYAAMLSLFDVPEIGGVKAK